MWVRGLCRAWELPLEEGQSAHPRRTEASAREQRYEFLHNAAERLNASLIATAHHADDQAETVLFRMVRGTGITGLAAIPARRGAIVRPLLRYRRTRLVDYADAQGLRYRDDPTNRDLSFARNRIRHVILPALENVKPGAAAALARIADEAEDLEAALTWVLERLEKEVISIRDDGALQLARPLLLSYHPWVRARVMRRVLHRLGQVPDRSGTQAALEFITTGASGGVIELAGGLRVEREFDRLIVQRSAPAAPADRPLTIPEPGTGRGAVMIGGRRFDVAWSNTSASDEPAEAFDPTTLRFPLELRSWRPGDRIRLAYGSKKLKKLFAERRVARGSRSRIPVLVDSGDRVVWVVGVTRAMGMEPEPGGQGFRIRVANGEHG
jgi:tRNA(Ile)-lysidine synthase